MFPLFSLLTGNAKKVTCDFKQTNQLLTQKLLGTVAGRHSWASEIV
jgi:hypothetical protein